MLAAVLGLRQWASSCARHVCQACWLVNMSEAPLVQARGVTHVRSTATCSHTLPCAGHMTWAEVLEPVQMVIIVLRMGNGPSMRAVTRFCASSLDPSVLVRLGPCCMAQAESGVIKLHVSSWTCRHEGCLRRWVGLPCQLLPIALPISCCSIQTEAELCNLHMPAQLRVQEYGVLASALCDACRNCCA